MSIQRIIAPTVKEPPVGTWSNCLAVGGIAYIAGMTARSSTFDGIEGETAVAQTRVILGKIKALVEAAGGAMSDIVKVVIYVTDIKDRDGVWLARREYFQGQFPVSTLVEVSALADPRMKVEIEAIAHVGASARA